MIRCAQCKLISVYPNDRISSEAEKARYDRHTNSPSDAGYRAFLEDVAQVIATIPLQGRTVLDFGSGQHAVLSDILSQQGYACDAYDPLYGRAIELIPGSYDLVVACEVIEHLRSIRDELDRLRLLCHASGYILFRTEFTDGVADFSRWHYMNDETHLFFFARETWNTVADLMHIPLAWTHKNHFACFGPA